MLQSGGEVLKFSFLGLFNCILHSRQVLKKELQDNVTYVYNKFHVRPQIKYRCLPKLLKINNYGFRTSKMVKQFAVNTTSLSREEKENCL